MPGTKRGYSYHVGPIPEKTKVSVESKFTVQITNKHALMNLNFTGLSRKEALNWADAWMRDRISVRDQVCLIIRQEPHNKEEK